MAKPKNEANPGMSEGDDFDFSKFLPEGYDAKDLRKVGGLTPIYAPKLAFEQKWDPVVGFIDRVMVLDMGEEIKDEKQRYRPFLVVELTSPNKGAVGPKSEQEVVSLNKGDDILVPVSGSIKNVKALEIAATDPANVYLGMFRVLGEKDLQQAGKPSPMWVIDARLHSKTKKREGRFLLSPINSREPKSLAEENGGGVTSTGVRYDKDGVVQESPQA